VSGSDTIRRIPTAIPSLLAGASWLTRGNRAKDGGNRADVASVGTLLTHEERQPLASADGNCATDAR
jgi:hypothetical protein